MEKTRDELLREIAALREERDTSHELTQRIIETMPGGIVHVGPTGAILRANREALRVLGLSYDEITKQYTTDFETVTITEDGATFAAADYPVTRALVTGQPQPPVTIGVRKPNGEVSWAIFTAVPVGDLAGATGALVTFLDITERRRSETALRASEVRLRSILESAPNPIAVTDREGRITYLNHPGPGLTMADIIGREAWAHVVPADQEVGRAAIQRALAGELVRFEISGQSGARYLNTAGPVRGVEGITGTAIVGWDITELRELQTHLMISDRLASLGTLAAGVAHEINNPLTYLLANLALLAPTITEARAKEWIASALEGGERIRTIVSDLGSFSHVGEGPRAPLDVSLLLDSSIRMADNAIRYRAKVIRDYRATCPVVANDARLGQVFLNLIINAAQAIPEGASDAHAITLATRDDGNWVVVEITDTGVGIPPELRDKIFDAFVTTKPRGVGTGLGLYICRAIVDSLGGALTVEATGGRGATFRVRLPASRTRSEPAPPPAVVVKPPRLRILVVDDEPSIVKVMQSFLATHQVTVARSGREAIRAFASEQFDVAFCDLIMADLTGMDVYAHLAEHQPGREACLVFMTGGAFTDRAQQFLDSVPNRVVAKPFALRAIEEIVASRSAR